MSHRKEPAMKKYTGKHEDILGRMMELKGIEAVNIEYAERDLPGAGNPLIKTMLQTLRLEAEKRSLLQQMIVDSIEKEAVHLSPDELQHLSGHLNRQIEADEKALSLAKKAFENSELAIPRYLLLYLMEDLKKENNLLKQFEDELKVASIPTSAGAKTSGSYQAA